MVYNGTPGHTAPYGTAPTYGGGDGPRPMINAPVGHTDYRGGPGSAYDPRSLPTSHLPTSGPVYGNTYRAPPPPPTIYSIPGYVPPPRPPSLYVETSTYSGRDYSYSRHGSSKAAFVFFAILFCILATAVAPEALPAMLFIGIAVGAIALVSWAARSRISN